MYYGERIRLRIPKIDDAETIQQKYNDLEIRQYLKNVIPVSLEDEKEWIRQVQSDIKNQKGYTFVIENEENEFLGTTGIGSISNIHQSANLGIAITNKKYWGQGYGTDAMRTICGFGFQLVNLHRIELEVHQFNTRAIRSYEKTGFTEVGRKRKAHWIMGEYVDSIVMDILADEYLQRYGEVELSDFTPFEVRN